MADKPKTASAKILHNSFWLALEQVLETVVFFGTSIMVARAFGPDKLGYFSYISFFVGIVTRTSGSGLASATRKYMSEFLALDRLGTANAVFNLAFRYQLLASVAIAGVSIAGVLLFGEHGYRIMAVILLASLVPGVMSCVAAQANQAFEDSFDNTISALGYIFSYALVLVLTVYFHWDLIGVASAMLVGRTVEFVWRTIPLRRRLRKFPLDRLDREIVVRIRRFCLESIGIQLVMSVVWDRSEFIFLRYFAPWVMENGVLRQNITQLGFYSVSFGLANNLLVIPRTFSGATGMTLMVEATRDPGRIDSIVKNACRYLLLIVLPVHLGAAAIAAQALAFAYGTKYVGAGPVMVVASILAIPRAFGEISQILLTVAERQKLILIWLSVTGAINIVLDWFLIRRYGAVGAAWGNGLAQCFAIFITWHLARRYYAFSFPVWNAVRLFAATVTMAALAYYALKVLPYAAYLNHTLPGLEALIAAVASAGVAYLLMVKLVGGLLPSDRLRLAPIGNRLPPPIRRAYLAVLAFATPATT
jgi:O-antigen/teichoic acid export membrane protein